MSALMAAHQHRVAGGGGLDLHVVETGNAAGPSLLFIHGFCQSTYAWRNQLESDLQRDFRLVAFDLRGHGRSGKPLEAEAYSDGGLWADDVAAVMGELNLRRTIIVGWSYAGLVISDYLRVHGQDRVAAIKLAACRAAVGKGTLHFINPRYLELYPAMFSNEVSTLVPAMSAFADMCVATPLAEAERLAILGASVLVPAQVREALQRRTVNNDDVMAKLSIPVLVTHGAKDAIVLPSSSEHNARVIPGAQLSIYPEAGHSTFAEDPVRFNRELRELAGRMA